MNDWRDNFHAVLRHLEAHAEQRDAALVALRAAIVANTPSDEFVCLKVAAFHSQYDPETIRLWAQRGLIASQRCGGRWLINVTSLQQYLQSRGPKQQGLDRESAA